MHKNAEGDPQACLEGAPSAFLYTATAVSEMERSGIELKHGSPSRHKNERRPLGLLGGSAFGVFVYGDRRQRDGAKRNRAEAWLAEPDISCRFLRYVFVSNPLPICYNNRVDKHSLFRRRGETWRKHGI